MYVIGSVDPVLRTLKKKNLPDFGIYLKSLCILELSLGGKLSYGNKVGRIRK